MTEREVSSERVIGERLTPEQLLEWASDTNNPLFDYDRVPDHLISGAIALAQELLALRSSVKTGIRIKPLEWERVTESPVFHWDETRRFWKASNPFGGSFWVNVHTEDFEGEVSSGGKKYPNSAAAMNAVEDHLRACVLSAIEAPSAEGDENDNKLWRAGTAMKGTDPALIHPDDKGHRTRFSDSSFHDEVCVLCGATDGRGDNRLERPCPKAPAAASEVTDSMVQTAWEAYDAKSGYSKPERFRAALTAALKGDRT